VTLCAHSLTGIGEIVLLPLDVLKIKRQCVDPSSLSSRAPARVPDPLTRPPRVQDQPGGVPLARLCPDRPRRGLLAVPRRVVDRGAQRARLVRRASPLSFPRSTDPASEADPFALALALQLFGGSAFTKEYVFKLEDYRTATWYQNFIASIAGSVRRLPPSLLCTLSALPQLTSPAPLARPQISSIAISQPLDVIKTRIQNQNFESKVGGMTVVRELIKNEGASAFFKGLTPKVLCVVPFAPLEPHVERRLGRVLTLLDSCAASSAPSSSSRSPSLRPSSLSSPSASPSLLPSLPCASTDAPSPAHRYV